MRGIALILMVINHTSRDWMDVGMGWARYHLVYGSLLLPAAMFLFLVGFCLPISFHRHRHAGLFFDELAKYYHRCYGAMGEGLFPNLIMLPRGRCHAERAVLLLMCSSPSGSGSSSWVRWCPCCAGGPCAGC
jgi:hypothetical protein